MQRRWLSFRCADAQLAAALDAATGETGLLIVSGGNEIASGAHAGMARLAARVAGHGFPVFRFDRRGVGDSPGENRGYAASGDDIVAAVHAFREVQPQIRRLFLFGNCDAATALAQFHGRCGADGLILTNPWLIEADGELPPPAAIKARYSRRLRDPRQWLRLLRGKVDIGRIFKGLKSISHSSQENYIARQFGQALVQSPLPVRIILAKHDATALAFSGHWHSPALAALRAEPRVTLREIDTASHSFARPGDAEALTHEVIAAIEAASGEL